MKLPGGLDIQQMMQQAQKMQEQMSRDMHSLRAHSSAGGGMVQVEMNGHKELLTIRIEPEATGDIEMLQDLIIAACNEASRKIDEILQRRLGNVLDGLNVPGMDPGAGSGDR